MKAVGYVRASTSDQQITLALQEKKVRQTALVKDAYLVDVVVDSGESAGTLDRPGMAKVLEMVAAKEVDAVIVYKLDRLTRNIADLDSLVKTFRKKEVSLISVMEFFDTETAFGRLVMNFQTLISQWERETIGERTESALQHIKSQGYAAGEAPFGWTAPPRTEEEKKNKIRKPLVRNETEQEIMKRVTELRAMDWTWADIADDLNQKGFRTREGGEWIFSSARRVWSTAQKTIAA